MDRFADQVLGFLAGSPDPTGCDAHLEAVDNSLRLSPCDDFAVIGDPETERQFCLYHWRKKEAGEMAYLTR